MASGKAPCRGASILAPPPRVCAGIFQGLVVQQAWEPDLDVTSYIESVLGILDGLAAAARAEATVGLTHADRPCSIGNLGHAATGPTCAVAVDGLVVLA